VGKAENVFWRKKMWLNVTNGLARTTNRAELYMGYTASPEEERITDARGQTEQKPTKKGMTRRLLGRKKGAWKEWIWVKRG